MTLLQCTDFPRYIEQLSNEILQVGSYLNHQIRVLLPGDVLGVGPGCDQPVMQRSIRSLQIFQELSVQPEQAIPLIQVRKNEPKTEVGMMIGE
jgi:hypothetical protein